jgi:RNA polymerase sigma-70 factor (ECF subfamily)
MTRTPVSLLQRLRLPGDVQAWRRFVSLYALMLLVWAERLGLQSADAADLVQEVLLLLYRKLPEFSHDPDRSFRGWLHVVLLNKWRELRRKSVPSAADPETLAGVAADDGFRDIEEVEYRRHLVRRALEALRDEFPATMWRAFEQYVVAGRSVEEVAAELGVRPGTVYAAKSRVMTRLRCELDGLLD